VLEKRFVWWRLLGAVSAGLLGLAVGGCSPRPTSHEERASVSPEQSASSHQASQAAPREKPSRDKAKDEARQSAPPGRDTGKDKPEHDKASKPTPPSPPFGSWAQFDSLHAMIRPHANEAPWTSVPWEADLYEARKKAAAEGKPLFVWSANADPIGCT
jgi:hypothetical protein